MTSRSIKFDTSNSDTGKFDTGKSDTGKSETGKTDTSEADICESNTSECKICQGPAAFFDRACILGRHQVGYYRCSQCGFIQTETPYWLDQAYSTAIASQDVGIMMRNLVNAEVASAVWNLLLPGARRGVDFGGGHGIFVRLMRDRGFDFYWRDRFASNDYARGFELPAEDSSLGGAAGRYDLATAFEVLEHLPDPMPELERIFALGENILVTTALLPDPPPKVRDWWYYMPASGQHVSFFTRASLERIAARCGRFLLSNGQHHLFARERKRPFLFRLATSYRTAWIANRVRRRPSLIPDDFRRLNGGST